MSSLYIEVISAENCLPATGVRVTVAGKSAVTDKCGCAFIRSIECGKHEITASLGVFDPCEIFLPEKTDVYTRVFLTFKPCESQKNLPEKSKSKKIKNF